MPLQIIRQDITLMEFGIRYYVTFKTLEDKNRVFDDSIKKACKEKTKM